MDRGRGWGSVLVLAAAFLSGGVSLSYEVVWSRALVVPLGNSADAAVLVLCGFMLGIGAGSRLGGGWSERLRSPLLGYAFVEAILSLYGVIAPHTFVALSRIGANGSLPMGIVVRSLTALLLVGLPCLGVGATFPLLVRAVASTPHSLALRIGIAYAANTAGAAAGAIATGFWGIPALGLRRCGAVAAAVQLTVAVLLCLAHATRERKAEPSLAPDSNGASTPPTSAERMGLLVAFVMGFAMLGCEALWARELTFVFGHDTYAFATLLALVLLGLACGSLIHRSTAHTNQNALLGWLVTCFAVSVILSFWGASSAVIHAGRDPLHLDSYGGVATSPWLELYRELVYASLLVFAPSACAGAVYATACSVYGSDSPEVGRRTGTVALVNGVGSAIGAIVAAFGLVGLVGIQLAIVSLAVLCFLVAAFVLWTSQRPKGALRAAFSVTLPGAAMLLLVLGLPPRLPRSVLLEVLGPRHQSLLFYEEARSSTVSVISNRINGERQLVINAVNEVTTRLVHDQSFKLLGHLGPLLHARPRQAVMICLGAGLSAGAALRHPLDRLDVVDLSPTVARAAARFRVENRGALDDPRLKLHIGDGRQYLLNSSIRYDVAIVDSTHPKAVDSWILYTKEFYELLSARLDHGGIVVQWLPLHGLSEREFRIIVATFRAVFPNMTLWANAGFETYGQVGYAKLVGVRQDGELVIDYGRLAARLSEPEIHDDLEPFGMARPEEILDLFVAGPRDLSRWTDGLPIQTDDQPFVPYTTRYSKGPRMTPPLLLAVRSLEPPQVLGLETPSDPARDRVRRAYEVEGLVLAGMLEAAARVGPDATKVPLFLAETRKTLPYYSALAREYADNPDRLFESASQLANLGHPGEARAAYARALELRPKDVRTRVGLALLLSQTGEHSAAIEILSRLRRENPKSGLIAYDLGSALLAAGDAEGAVMHLRSSVSEDPDLVFGRVVLSEAEAKLGRTERAERVLLDLVEDNPWVPAAYDLLGRLSSLRGAASDAVQYHRTAVRLSPYDADFRYRLGVALGHTRAFGDAEEEYLAALRFSPNHSDAMRELGLLLAGRQLFDQAADWYVRALEIAPRDAEAAYELGRTLVRKGDTAQALGALCLALELRPGLPDAQTELGRLGRRCPSTAGSE